jgi:hypothetical protein
MMRFVLLLSTLELFMVNSNVFSSQSNKKNINKVTQGGRGANQKNSLKTSSKSVIKNLSLLTSKIKKNKSEYAMG